MSPSVSVITPFYNRIEYLKECLSSMGDQTYSDWEHILINDNDDEDDGLMNYISSLSYKSKIKILNRRGLPKGAPRCRNIGLNHAQGEFIVFLDSDDLLATHCLEQRMRIMKDQPELDFAVFPMLIFSDTIADGSYLWNVDDTESDLYRFLRTDAVWQTSGPIWRRRFLKELDGYTEGLTCWQDVDFHLKALFRKPAYRKFYNLKPDCFYRKHSQTSISQGRINTLEKLRSRIDIFHGALRHIDNLKENHGYLKSIRIMLIGILLSALKSRNYKIFFQLFLHRQSGLILNFKERLIIALNFLLHYFRFTSFPYLNTVDRYYFRVVSSKMNLGRHKWML